MREADTAAALCMFSKLDTVEVKINRCHFNRNIKAWTQPPPPPRPPPATATPAPAEPTRGMSFVAIQHLQQEQVTPVRDRRSLREIQEEEHALQEEADFLKWWTAEEERVQQEALALAQFEQVNSQLQRPPKKPKPPKQKKDDKSAGGESGPKQHPRKPRPPKKIETSVSSGSGSQPPPRNPERPRETAA